MMRLNNPATDETPTTAEAPAAIQQGIDDLQQQQQGLGTGQRINGIAISHIYSRTQHLASPSEKIIRHVNAIVATLPPAKAPSAVSVLTIPSDNNNAPPLIAE